MLATTLPPDALLDFYAWVGQRSITFRFMLYDFKTGLNIKELHPVNSGTIPTLSHDTSRTIVRQVSGLYFTSEDTEVINIVSHRLRIQMVIEDRDPVDLGFYLFADNLGIQTTAGVESSITMFDSGFIVDQQMEQSYSAGTFTADGTVISFRQVDQAIQDILAGLPIKYSIESTPYYTISSIAAGSTRGSFINDLSVEGDFFAPWFDNTDTMRFIRTFDPAAVIPDFDFDSNFRIDRDSIRLTNDLLDAPNRFIVISNGSVTDMTLPVVGVYDVPAAAPHSIFNRGFVIPHVEEWQVDYAAQAYAIAANIAARSAIFETVTFTTPPDPRHDSYDVFRFNGVNWLELSWEMQLIAGGTMNHTGRRSYQ